MLGIKRLNRSNHISVTTAPAYTQVSPIRKTATSEVPVVTDERTLQMRAMYARLAERQALMDAEAEATRMW